MTKLHISCLSRYGDFDMLGLSCKLYSRQSEAIPRKPENAVEILLKFLFVDMCRSFCLVPPRGHSILKHWPNHHPMATK